MATKAHPSTSTLPAVAVPEHKLYESPNSRSIDVANWTILASTNPIANAGQYDALQAQLGLPLPEMMFANNVLELEHKPSGWKYSFDAEHALAMVKNGPLEEGDGGVKVGYAEKWLKSRSNPSSSLPMPKTVATKPYDWTYTTLYQGHASSSDAGHWQPADISNPAHVIPVAELTRPDPILFYAEVPLFESELDDNGASSLLVRIRVMPGCIFILSRFTLRVDNVLFRIFDTRLYHSFSSSPPLVVKETNGWEAPYEFVKERLPRRDDLSPLTDPMWIGRILSSAPPEFSQKRGAGTGWRGLGTKHEISILHGNA